MRWLAPPLWLWFLLAACSSASPAARPAPPPGEPIAAEPPPDDRECDELITHAVALGIDELAARPAEPQTTSADHEAIRRRLHDEFMPGCRTLSRGAYRCAMTATTLDALASCQRTPSSSTSNSKVAPAGMTPPAPRSP